MKSDNVRDHRAGTIDLSFKKHAQVRLRVHHIVIRRLVGEGRQPQFRRSTDSIHPHLPRTVDRWA